MSALREEKKKEYRAQLALHNFHASTIQKKYKEYSHEKQKRLSLDSLPSLDATKEVQSKPKSSKKELEPLPLLSPKVTRASLDMTLDDQMVTVAKSASFDKEPL